MGFCQFSQFLHRSLGLAAVGVFGMPAIALAHGAHIQSRPASAIEIQAMYDSGEPMAKAQVQVYSPDDPQTPVFTGLTDEAGRYVFVPDQPGDWEVSVRQAGHGDIAVIAVAGAGEETPANAATDEGTEIAGEGEIAIVPSSSEVNFETPAGLTPLQRGIIAGAITWGCVGTALYFRRGKQ